MKVLTALTLIVFCMLFGCLQGQKNVLATDDQVDREIRYASDRAAILTKALQDNGIDGNVIIRLSGQPVTVFAKQDFGLQLPVDWEILVVAQLRPQEETK